MIAESFIKQINCTVKTNSECDCLHTSIKLHKRVLYLSVSTVRDTLVFFLFHVFFPVKTWCFLYFCVYNISLRIKTSFIIYLFYLCFTCL